MVECHDIRRCNYMYLKVSGVKCDYFEFNILTRIRSYAREKPSYELSKRGHTVVLNVSYIINEFLFNIMQVLYLQLLSGQ